MQHVTDCHVDPVAGRATAEERGHATIQHLALAGMGCPNCANRIRNALLATRGVVDVEVDLHAALATVWYRAPRASVSHLIDAVDGAGRATHHRYLAVPVPAHHRS
jgi:copper chaperone CopZ